MGEEVALKPKLSILLPATRGYASVRAALASWESQTRRDQLEILILCPAPEPDAILTPGQTVVVTGTRDLHEARAWGMQYVAADYVVLAEDHCLPDPDWAEGILQRLNEDWDAIGATLRPGDRSSPWARGSFLIGYGEWMEPIEAGPVNTLSGWNVVLRTDLLRQRGDRLSRDLILAAFLLRDLGREGRRFFLENRARMRHFDPPGGRRQVDLVRIVGLGFGAIRTAAWPRAAQVLYPFAFPAVAALHWRRALRHYLRAGRAGRLGPGSLFASLILALAWAFGESIGAVKGLNAVVSEIWKTEIKPVSPEDVARSDRAESTRTLQPAN